MQRLFLFLCLPCRNESSYPIKTATKANGYWSIGPKMGIFCLFNVSFGSLSLIINLLIQNPLNNAQILSKTVLLVLCLPSLSALMAYILAIFQVRRDPKLTFVYLFLGHFNGVYFYCWQWFLPFVVVVHKKCTVAIPKTWPQGILGCFAAVLSTIGHGILLAGLRCIYACPVSFNPFWLAIKPMAFFWGSAYCGNRQGHGRFFCFHQRCNTGCTGIFRDYRPLHFYTLPCERGFALVHRKLFASHQ